MRLSHLYLFKSWSLHSWERFFSISRYLFLFCVEAFSSLLRRAETQQLLHGARLCRSRSTITHFLDDYIIFSLAGEREGELISQTLQKYELALGQKVNLDKSEVTFSSGISKDARNRLASILGVRRDQQHGKYLTIPSTIGKHKNEVFRCWWIWWGKKQGLEKVNAFRSGKNNAYIVGTP